MNVRRRNNIQKGLRDYMVPIIGVFLVIILLYSIFSGGETPTKVDTENKTGLEVVLIGTNSESYIVYPGDYKKKIEGDMSLYKGEEIIVKEGNVKVSLAGLGSLNLDKLGELKYLENGDFSLLSSDLWVNSESAININMKFANVKVGDKSHVSFSQNEMGSTVYLLSGVTEVVNLAGKSTVLAAGQKLTISRLDANNKEVDLSINKENIDDYYKQSDWFILNNGASFLNLDTEKTKEETSSGATTDSKTSSGSTSSSTLLAFSNLSDESNVSASNISVSGNYFDEEITSITVNGIEAKLNTEMKTFKFENVPVPQKENNLVFKVMDDANDVLSKFVYTIYYEGGQTGEQVAAESATTNTKTNTNTQTSGGGFKVQTYNVDGTQFTFTEPTTKDAFTTYDDFITIRGNVLAEGITKITVNDFALSSFKGGTWRYHAATTNNNLSVGTNIYEIKYYDAGGKLVYTNYFTIILKKAE